MAPLIDIKSVSKTYATGSFTVEALKNVSMTVEPGEFVALVGPSGSGKSTLLHIMGFLDRPDSGEYYFAGHPTASLGEGRLAAIRSRMVGFIFQSFHLLKRTTAKDNVLLPMVYTGLGTDDRKALDCLSLVGLADRVKHKSNELSGGQCQRVAIARSLVNDPLVVMADEPTGNLDAASRHEVMQAIKSLNERGLTVIVVTHDDEVAAMTNRVVRMKDGEIVSDETVRPPAASKPAAAPLPPARLGFSPSEFAEQLKVAFKAIWSHKTRSVLTVLGIFIGVGAIISLMTISEGFMKSLLSGASEDDAKKVWVTPRWQPGKPRRRFTMSEVDALRLKVPLAENVQPMLHRDLTITAGDRRVESTVNTHEGFALKDQVPPGGYFQNRAVAGRFFTKAENLSRARVAVINHALAKKIFDTVEAVNAELRIKGLAFTVVGVTEDHKTEQMFGGRPTAYIPLNTAAKRVFGETRLSYLEVTAPTPADTKETRRQIIEVLREERNLREDAEDDFEVRTFEAQIEMFKQTMGKISLVVYGIAGISLLVGGIGIMNIMLVSVTERTREIGLRKALGARNSDILSQFLIEAVVLCVLGGVLGVGLGYGLAWAAWFFTKVQPALGAGTIAFAFGFSTLIGVGFGFWPAMRAAMLDPIEALRYE
ncbi:MAG: ABC transporter permease [Elusimicrobiales bacterium]|nr:ABC transporter permease [Elusimicrobiales bacterium]